MSRYIAMRLLSGVLLLLTVSILAFALLYFMPGSAVDYLVDENATAETVARITEQYGLDTHTVYTLAKQPPAWQSRKVDAI